MSGLTQKDRLQPSLLDRLSDDEPERNSESREKRVLSMRALRQNVLRDVGWLLSTTRSLSDEVFEQYPHVAQSVLNYGTPDISGALIQGINLPAFTRAIRQTIIHFEPRIIPKTLSVNALESEEAESNQAIILEIEGDMWALPYPERLYLRTELDLVNATIKNTQSID